MIVLVFIFLTIFLSFFPYFFFHIFFICFLKSVDISFFATIDKNLQFRRVMQCQHHMSTSMLCSRLQAVFNGFEIFLHAQKHNSSGKFDVLRNAWDCRFCSCTFETRHGLAQHYRRKHPVFNSKSISIRSRHGCNFKQVHKQATIVKKQASALKKKKDEKTKEKKTSALFQCRICTKRTDSFFGLQVHCRVIHNVKIQKSDQMSIEFLLHSKQDDKQEEFCLHF